MFKFIHESKLLEFEMNHDYAKKKIWDGKKHGYWITHILDKYNIHLYLFKAIWKYTNWM